MKKEVNPVPGVSTGQKSACSRYVVGFVFDAGFTEIALIRKNKPEWQAGLLNGIGGKIEEGESPAVAMRREFNEEAGCDISYFKHFCSMAGTNNDGGGFELECFWAQGPLPMLLAQESEQIEFLSVDEIASRRDTIGNLPWLITLARDFGMGIFPPRIVKAEYGPSVPSESPALNATEVELENNLPVPVLAESKDVASQCAVCVDHYQNDDEAQESTAGGNLAEPKGDSCGGQTPSPPPSSWTVGELRYVNGKMLQRIMCGEVQIAELHSFDARDVTAAHNASRLEDKAEIERLTPIVNAKRCARIGERSKWLEEAPDNIIDAQKHIKNLKQLVLDSCEDDTDIRNLARPIIGEIADGDGYGVTPLVDVVKELIKKTR